MAEAAPIACSASGGALAATGLEFGRQPAIHQRAIEHRRDLLRLIAGETAADRRDLDSKSDRDLAKSRNTPTYRRITSRGKVRMRSPFVGIA